jgi:hypothetical protein
MKITYPIKVYDVKMSVILQVYITLHALFVLHIYTFFYTEKANYSVLVLSFFVLFTIYNLTCFGALFDGKSNGYFMELSRLALILVVNNYFKHLYFEKLLNSSDFIHTIINVVFGLSFVAIAIASFLIKETKTIDVNNNIKKGVEKKKVK